MSALSQLLKAFQVEATVFHNGQYCGVWAVDTSGSRNMAFHVVSHGTCSVLVDSEWTNLNTGDAVLFPSDAPHRMSCLDDPDIPLNESESIPLDQLQLDGTGLVCGYFCYQNPVFDKMLEQLPNCLIIRANESPPIHKIIELLLEESKSSGQDHNFMLNRLSDCLLYLVLRDKLDQENGVFAAVVHPKIGKALKVIHSEADHRASIEELAEAAGMSRSAFTDLFKKIVGLSPAGYQTQWRMTNAWRWLVDEGVSTIEAATRCGYESEASFSKAFKRVMGVGPGKAKKMGRGLN